MIDPAIGKKAATTCAATRGWKNAIDAKLLINVPLRRD
jgi:hypothetical protein